MRQNEAGTIVTKSEMNNKNIKLNGQSPWINLVHLCASTMNTMTNHCLVTKASLSAHSLQILLFGPLTFEPNKLIWGRYKLSPYT